MISVLKIWGQTGSKMEFFESFSQSMPRIFLILGLKEHFLVYLSGMIPGTVFCLVLEYCHDQTIFF